MTTQTLTDFFREKQRRAASNGTARIDWDQRKRELAAHLDDLYRTIEQYLAEPMRERFVTASRKKKQLTEEHLGAYELDALNLQVGDESVRFEPRGRNIAGAEGRVDIHGPAGQRTLVVQDGKWSIINRTPATTLVPLTPDSLLEALRGVMTP